MSIRPVHLQGRSATKELLFRILERNWSLLLGALRPAFGGSSTAIRFGGGGLILVLATHPDDEAAGCAGALLQHLAAGDDVQIAYITDGRRSRAFGMDEERMALTRRREAIACSGILSNRPPIWIGLPEGEWQPRTFVGMLAELLEKARPTVVYAPSRVDFHLEHRRVAKSLARSLVALKTHQRPDHIRVYPGQVPLTPLLANRYAAIGPVADGIRAALSAYESQVGSLQPVGRMRRYAGILHGQPGPVEEFLDLSIDAYRTLETDPLRAPLAPFRGLRPNPASDIWSYLSGYRARRRLRGRLNSLDLADLHHP